MYYKLSILAKGKPLYVCWLAANWPAKFKALRAETIKKEDVAQMCESILNVLQIENRGTTAPTKRFSLRLSAHLMKGMIVIYDRQLDVLYKDIYVLLMLSLQEDMPAAPRRRSQPNHGALPALEGEEEAAEADGEPRSMEEPLLGPSDFQHPEPTHEGELISLMRSGQFSVSNIRDITMTEEEPNMVDEKRPDNFEETEFNLQDLEELQRIAPIITITEPEPSAAAEQPPPIPQPSEIRSRETENFDAELTFELELVPAPGPRVRKPTSLKVDARTQLSSALFKKGLKDRFVGVRAKTPKEVYVDVHKFATPAEALLKHIAHAFPARSGLPPFVGLEIASHFERNLRARPPRAEALRAIAEREERRVANATSLLGGGGSPLAVATPGSRELTLDVRSPLHEPSLFGLSTTAIEQRHQGVASMSSMLPCAAATPPPKEAAERSLFERPRSGSKRATSDLIVDDPSRASPKVPRVVAESESPLLGSLDRTPVSLGDAHLLAPARAETSEEKRFGPCPLLELLIDLKRTNGGGRVTLERLVPSEKDEYVKAGFGHLDPKRLSVVTFFSCGVLYEKGAIELHTKPNTNYIEFVELAKDSVEGLFPSLR